MWAIITYKCSKQIEYRIEYLLLTIANNDVISFQQFIRENTYLSSGHPQLQIAKLDFILITFEK